MPRRRDEPEITVDLATLVAGGVAAGRVAIGVAALLWPAFPLRPWVGGAAAGGAATKTLGRALGVRDVALGVGALRALALRTGAGGRAGSAGSEAAYWVAAAGLCDAGDAAATVLGWRRLSRSGRWFVLAAATGAAAASLAAGHRLEHG